MFDSSQVEAMKLCGGETSRHMACWAIDFDVQEYNILGMKMLSYLPSQRGQGNQFRSQKMRWAFHG
jgi:hypothetical protein